MKNSKFMSLAEVCKKFNRHKSTIYLWVKEKHFPHTQFAGRTYYNKEDVEKWEAEEGWRISKDEYDFTTEEVETPAGPAKFIKYDGYLKRVKVELDNSYTAWFEAKDVYPIVGKEKV
jgi:excisionase family DNA binding protein